jgi:hypothetical protein
LARDPLLIVAGPICAPRDTRHPATSTHATLRHGAAGCWLLHRDTAAAAAMTGPSGPLAVALLSAALGLGGAVYTLDPSKLSRVFDGHGGLSAGASSRLLYDYAEPYRSDVLDYLYKPNFGAQLTICKVEIGAWRSELACVDRPPEVH